MSIIDGFKFGLGRALLDLAWCAGIGLALVALIGVLWAVDKLREWRRKP